MDKKIERHYELSKSQYVKGVTCYKKLWLRNNLDRKLATPPSEFQEHLFTQGHEVGDLARTFFPGGELIHEGSEAALEAVEHTKRALQNKIPCIFEATFIFDEILVRIDVLRRNQDGSFDLIEVKSTTSVKDHHLDDISIQRYVVENLGFKISNAIIMHLNNEYVRHGQLDLQKLFLLTPVNELMKSKLELVPHELKAIREVLKETKEPEQAIGSVCKNPYPCEYQNYCWKHVGSDSIHKISRITDDKREKLIELGVEELKDVPDDFKLSDLQAIQVRASKDGQPHMDLAAIRTYLSGLEYPLYFLDYETIGYAIPKFDGTRSYEQLPFQFSLHIQSEPGGKLVHAAYLHDDSTDPRVPFAKALNEVIGNGGTVVVYHASFERGKTTALIEAVPELKSKLSSIVHRMWDLETPFSKKWYYDSGFQGSSSIKYVLPVFAPELSYKDLAIQQGSQATLKFQEMIQCSSRQEKELIRRNLLVYCERDSIAMVRILEGLNSLFEVPIQQKKAQ